MIVRETAKEGEAEICFNVSNFVLKINLSEKNSLHYLKQQQVADAVIFEFPKPEKVVIHIIECKRKVKVKQWEKIKEQFEGALLNSLGLMGILGLSDVQNVIFYTAYRESSLNLKPVFIRKENENPSPIEDWIKDKVSILSLSKATHKKIQLDSEGKGSVTLKSR